MAPGSCLFVWHQGAAKLRVHPGNMETPESSLSIGKSLSLRSGTPYELMAEIRVRNAGRTPRRNGRAGSNVRTLPVEEEL